MFRKLVAGLLVLSWVSLSAFDLLEDIQLGLELEVHSRADPPARTLAEGLDAINNIVESADRTPADKSNFLEQPAPHFSYALPDIAPRHIKLYKFHHAFRI